MGWNEAASSGEKDKSHILGVTGGEGRHWPVNTDTSANCPPECWVRQFVQFRGEISLRIQWAHYVDLVLPFEETHAQSGSGKQNAIEKMTICNVGRSAWLGKTGWPCREEARKGS